MFLLPSVLTISEGLKKMAVSLVCSCRLKKLSLSNMALERWTVSICVTRESFKQKPGFRRVVSYRINIVFKIADTVLT